MDYLENTNVDLAYQNLVDKIKIEMYCLHDDK